MSVTFAHVKEIGIGLQFVVKAQYRLSHSFVPRFYVCFIYTGVYMKQI